MKVPESPRPVGRSAHVPLLLLVLLSGGGLGAGGSMVVAKSHVNNERCVSEVELGALQARQAVIEKTQAELLGLIRDVQGDARVIREALVRRGIVQPAGSGGFVHRGE